ncbi:MAG: YfhO family protein, partial [Planctomycetaceae bacterium]|nr:YfhO family protein [Planctomycetaceae bacterium]
GWTAKPADGKQLQQYPVMRADYVLRAIPLKAGDHRIRLEYTPVSFTVGKWISLVAWLAFAVATSVCLVHRRASPGTPSGAAAKRPGRP